MYAPFWKYSEQIAMTLNIVYFS